MGCPDVGTIYLSPKKNVLDSAEQRWSSPFRHWHQPLADMSDESLTILVFSNEKKFPQTYQLVSMSNSWTPMLLGKIPDTCFKVILATIQSGDPISIPA